MDSEHVLVYVNSEAGDMAMRQIAWDLLARRWVIRATYLESAELFVTDAGEGKMNGGRTLVLLCDRANVERVFEHLGGSVSALAVPVVRAAL
ncbi:MAG: hypothetical protein SFX73_22115 [Kofleriaceae bacterium]|nr:hypothetical protein [Kofleriaceae bacterium]